MAENAHSIREKAAQFARKGQYKRAVQEYEKLLKLQPADARTLQQFAELLVRDGKKERAVEIFLEAAAAHGKAGFYDREVAVLKQALSIDPLRLDANLALAQALLAKKFERDAAAALLKAADALSQAGQADKEIELLQRAVELLPTDTQCKVRLGRLLRKQGRQEEARELIFSVAEQKSERVQPAQPPEPSQPAAPAPEPAPRVKPRSPLDQAAALIEQNRPEEAAPLLERLLKESSGNLQVLQLLAECYLRAGKPRLAVPICKRLARLARRKGDERRTRWALEKLESISASAPPPPLSGEDPADSAGEITRREEDTSG